MRESLVWQPRNNFLDEKGLVDSFAAVTKSPDGYPSWHWPVGPIEISARIDHLFRTRHLSTLESRILDGNGSDHRLVVSRLKWPKDEVAGKAV